MHERGLLSSEQEASELLSKVSPGVIGARVRRERKNQGVSIRDLAARANLAPHSITRLEAGQPFRAITLIKVCEALSIHVDRIASAIESEVIAAHRTEDDRWHFLDGYTQSALEPGSDRDRLARELNQNPLKILNSRLDRGNLIATVIEVYAPSQPRAHPGEEFVYALCGPVQVTVAGKAYPLNTGESLTFFGTEEHSYEPIGNSVGILLSVRSC